MFYLYNPNANANVIASDTNRVTTIPTGSTDASSGSQIYFNTTTNRFEYYLPFKVGYDVSIDNIIVTLNGVKLVKGTDYYYSTTNPYKLNLFGTVHVGDTIIIYYPTQNNSIYLYLESKAFVAKFDAITSSANGLFTAQITDYSDTGFSNILYSGTTPYITGSTSNNNTYMINIGDITIPNRTFIYRIKSDKYFIDMFGNTHTTTNYSNTITFKTDNRVSI
jgi:hypothetical protein